MALSHGRARLAGLVGAVSAILGVVLFFAPGTLSAVRGVFDSPSAPQVSAGDAIPPDTPIPSLSDDQKSQATALLAHDPGLRAILGAGRYTISDLGPWTDDQGEILGAAALLRLETPLNGERAWPLIRFVHGTVTKPPYRTRVQHLIVRNATEIDALVDLTTGKVVSLQPDGDAVGVAPGPDVVPLPSAGD